MENKLIVLEGNFGHFIRFSDEAENQVERDFYKTLPSLALDFVLAST